MFGALIILIRNGIANRFYHYLMKNPGNAFIIAFELLLVGIAAELWKGNDQIADELGVVAFVLACIGVGLQTLASIRTRHEESAINSAAMSFSH